MGTSRNGTILVIDDEDVMREILETLLTREGYDVRVASSGAEGLEMARALPFDAAIVDIMMPGLDGIATLDELRRIDDDLAVIIITAYASVESAIQAMKTGAFDYITKPFKNDEVVVVVRNAMERRRLVSENRNLRQNIQERYHKFANIIGKSPRMRQVFDLIIQAAPSRSTILIQGESGTGKELVARAIHTNSSRSERSFVTVNSGNLPPDLLESTLFGHVKGAFTGAVYPKKGMFDLADKGSIFFDEIGNVPLETQAKLLRVIQERDFMRLGGMETIKVDVRIIAATNVDLRQMMEEAKFREDLFYRLHVISIQLPPLRDRKDDIPLLVRHFLEKYGEENRKRDLEVMPEALDLLTEYDWPGNVRELENVIERAVVLTPGTRIGVELIPDHVKKAPNFHMPQFVVPPWTYSSSTSKADRRRCSSRRPGNRCWSTPAGRDSRAATPDGSRRRPNRPACRAWTTSSSPTITPITSAAFRRSPGGCPCGHSSITEPRLNKVSAPRRCSTRMST